MRGSEEDVADVEAVWYNAREMTRGFLREC